MPTGWEGSNTAITSPDTPISKRGRAIRGKAPQTSIERSPRLLLARRIRTVRPLNQACGECAQGDAPPRATR